MSPFEQMTSVQRRCFLQQTACGLGGMALASLLQRESPAAAEDLNPLAPKAPHFPAKAKNVIFLFMGGRPESARFVLAQARDAAFAWAAGARIVLEGSE